MSHWQTWHQTYDDPESSLSRRRAAVQSRIIAFLESRFGPLRIVSACAGDGRDVLEVLASRPEDAARVSLRLIEYDAELARRAETFAADRRLDVEIVVGDAGTTDAYAGSVPADLVMLCGVFGNVIDADIRETVAVSSQLVAHGGIVLWTRGLFPDLPAPSNDLAPTISHWFAEAGYVQTAYLADDTASFRVAEHRYDGPVHPLELGRTFFRFVERR